MNLKKAPTKDLIYTFIKDLEHELFSFGNAFSALIFSKNVLEKSCLP